MASTPIHPFDRLVRIMEDLRTQCPWDKKQTFKTLRTLTLEESYELADALLIESPDAIKEELGDLLLHIVFYSKIASENNWFTINDVLHSICEKLIRRHPHIYGDLKIEDEEEVKRNWERIKQKEGKKSLLEGVPDSMPALIKAQRMQDKVRQVGFEWKEVRHVWEKVQEELNELQEALESNADHQDVESEFGDVLFALVNYARFLNIDPESALEKVNKKFKSRFQYIERNAPRRLEEMTLEEMDLLWNQAKKEGL